MFRGKLAAILMIALTSVSTLCGIARADDAEENKQLKEQMKQMMQRMDQLQKQVDALSKQQTQANGTAAPPRNTVARRSPSPAPRAAWAAPASRSTWAVLWLRTKKTPSRS